MGLADRLRKTRLLFPFVIFFYCLFVKGGIRDGWAGVYYAFQRMLAEILLALYLIEDQLKGEALRAKGQVQGAGSAEQGARDRMSEVGSRNGCEKVTAELQARRSEAVEGVEARRTLGVGFREASEFRISNCEPRIGVR